MSVPSGIIQWRKGLRLDQLDHASVEEEEYKRTLKNSQLKLLNYQRSLAESKKTLVVLFEGPDAAGKGGAIKRMVERLEEYAHHYLWRFWNKLPAYGQIAVFDRSWYGRVLVERVEGFCSDREWKRAYEEINEFERLLSDDGTVFVKIYLHISKEEQLLRFKRRESDPYKHWKITDEDWRNRRKWDEHNEAAETMFERTSTEVAPWWILPANFKWNARVEVLRAVNTALEDAGIKKLS
jgi:polyphosphate kinase 2 (PPK2 family)